MTDNEIIEALQICEKGETTKDCIHCRFTHSGNCMGDLSMWALRIINRQKAEIERLTVENLQMVKSIKHLKTEAIKEMAGE